MLQFVMKPEDVGSVSDFVKFIHSKKEHSTGDLHTASQRLIEIYGDKIIPGGALDEELNEDEKFARIMWGATHDLLRKDIDNKDYKKYDLLYEKASTVKYKSKRFFTKLFWVLFIALIFFALIKYVFS